MLELKDQELIVFSTTKIKWADIEAIELKKDQTRYLSIELKKELNQKDVKFALWIIKGNNTMILNIIKEHWNNSKFTKTKNPL